MSEQKTPAGLEAEAAAALAAKEEAGKPGRKPKTVTLINKTKGLRRVAGIKILPDDKGVEISKDEFEALKANPVFAAQLADGEFEVK